MNYTILLHTLTPFLDFQYLHITLNSMLRWIIKYLIIEGHLLPKNDIFILFSSLPFLLILHTLSSSLPFTAIISHSHFLCTNDPSA